MPVTSLALVDRRQTSRPRPSAPSSRRRGFGEATTLVVGFFGRPRTESTAIELLIGAGGPGDATVRLSLSLPEAKQVTSVYVPNPWGSGLVTFYEREGRLEVSIPGAHTAMWSQAPGHVGLTFADGSQSLVTVRATRITADVSGMERARVLEEKEKWQRTLRVVRHQLDDRRADVAAPLPSDVKLRALADAVARLTGAIAERERFIGPLVDGSGLTDKAVIAVRTFEPVLDAAVRKLAAAQALPSGPMAAEAQLLAATELEESLKDPALRAKVLAAADPSLHKWRRQLANAEADLPRLRAEREVEATTLGQNVKTLEARLNDALQMLDRIDRELRHIALQPTRREVFVGY